MSAGLNLRTLASCASGVVLLAFAWNYQSTNATAQTTSRNAASQEPATPVFPPHYPPTADADPTIRHEVVVPMPARLSVERTSDRLSVGFDLRSPLKVKITVGRKMSIGVEYEMRVYPKGGARPLNAGGIGYAGIREPVAPGFLNGRHFLNSAQGGIPAPGKRYIIEEDVSIFETDVPAQHLWSPQSKRYRVLWAEHLKTVR